jgi:hypothetical protein
MNNLVATLVAGLFAVSSSAFAQTAAPATTPAPAPAAKAPAAPPPPPTGRTTATQGTGAAATAAAAAPTTVKAVQPGLLEVAGPRVNEVVAAGIQKITATPGKGGRSIAVQSPWGNSYFGWPKNVKPVAFTIETGKPKGAATINAPGFTDANKADYRAAMEAVVPMAIAKTGDAKAAKEHTRR